MKIEFEDSSKIEATDSKVTIEVISNCFGKCIVINNYRVTGQKPFGVGKVEYSLETTAKEIYKALGNSKDTAKPVIRFDNYNHEWWAGRCPNCNKIISFDYSVSRGEEGSRKCYCSKCGQLCDFEDI